MSILLRLNRLIRAFLFKPETMEEIQELDYSYLTQHLPVRNPNRQVKSIFNYLYPDIHKFNPEYVQLQIEKKKVWTMYHVDDDIYIRPGFNGTEGFLGVIFTNKPYSSNKVIIKL